MNDQSAQQPPRLLPPKLLPPHYFVLTLAAITSTLLLAGIDWNPTLLRSPWPWIGGAPLVAGVWMAVKGSRQFASHDTNIVPFTPATTLVQDGVFARSRNPMYTGMILALAGTALLVNHWLAWIPVVAFCLIIRWRFVRHEEAQMLSTFGEEHADYRKRVRRWI